jgi:hypothetical protein
VATWFVGLNEDLGRTRLRGVHHGFSSCQAEVEESGDSVGPPLRRKCVGWKHLLPQMAQMLSTKSWKHVPKQCSA